MIASSILIGRVVSPFESSVSGWRRLGISAYQSWVRLNALVSKEQGAENTLLPEPKGDIEFSNVFAI